MVLRQKSKRGVNFMNRQNPFMRSTNDCCFNNCQNKFCNQQPCCNECCNCNDRDENPCVVCPPGAQGPAGVTGATGATGATGGILGYS